MASQFTNAAEILALGFLFNSALPTHPTSWFVALSTSTPSTTAGGVTEPVGNGYARQPVVFGAPAGNPAAVANTGALTFTATGGDWGTITYMIVYTLVSGGVDLAIGQLTNSKLIQNGDSLQFAISSISITLT
jgi:hypothetical protein